MGIKSALFLLSFFTILLFTFVYFLVEKVEETGRRSGVADGITKTEKGVGDSRTVGTGYVEHESSIFDKLQDTTIGEAYVELDDGGYYNFEVDRVVAPVVNALQYATERQLPFVVWWTPFTGDAKGKMKRCWIGDCFFSTNRSLYNHDLTKAFLFYGSDFNVSDLPLPRKGYHEWGLLHEESPKNQAIFLYEDVMSIFNHTSTFRQRSHYPITTQYIISQSYLLKPPRYTYEQKQQIQRKEDLASLAYIQSGCNPPSDRDAYVNELQKYVRVDCYGECLHDRDLPPEYRDTGTMFSKGFVQILQKYKFILAFENGICDDYVTEKLFRTLFVGAIPVYKGAPNVREWLPNNMSAIIADDFASPKELAEYIKFVDQDAAEYDKYLDYKRSGISNSLLKSTLDNRKWGVDTLALMNFITGFECHVCDQIHWNRQLMASGGAGVGRVASHEHYGCSPPKKYDLPSVVGDEGWERDVWTWEYEQAAEKVGKLKDALGMS